MKRWILIILVAAAVIAGAVFVVQRKHTESKTEEVKHLYSVAVAKVAREDLANDVVCYAEFRPYMEVDLHAKVSGFVDKMNVDFGDKVKAGQLMATLEVPELHDELRNATARQQKAEADYTNARLINTRLVTVSREHPGLVAQQDIDTAEANERTTAATVAATKAEVEKDKTLVEYTQITAPFDGVVTNRYADPGALIQAGTASNTQAMPLVRVSDNYRLRLDFPVSVTYVSGIRVGDSVDVRVESEKKTFEGKITRFTHQVDLSTRTMETEVEVPNPDLGLIPGMYAFVTLKFDRRENALTVPVEAIAPGKQPTVYLVNAQDQIEERPVTIGVSTPYRVEVTSGLKENDRVMIGARALVKPGQKVRPKPINGAQTE